MPETTDQIPSDVYWVLDALSSLRDASIRYRLGVYSQEELELYEERAERVLRAWQGINTANSTNGKD